MNVDSGWPSHAHWGPFSSSSLRSSSVGSFRVLWLDGYQGLASLGSKIGFTGLPMRASPSDSGSTVTRIGQANHQGSAGWWFVGSRRPPSMIFTTLDAPTVLPCGYVHCQSLLHLGRFCYPPSRRLGPLIVSRWVQFSITWWWWLAKEHERLLRGASLFVYSIFSHSCLLIDLSLTFCW